MLNKSVLVLMGKRSIHFGIAFIRHFYKWKKLLWLKGQSHKIFELAYKGWQWITQKKKLPHP